MSTVVFNGEKFANQKENELKKRVSELAIAASMASVFFREDPLSIVYTNLKQAAAKRVGIRFQAQAVSFKDDFQSSLSLIRRFSQDPKFVGVMIQKPSKETFAQAISAPAIRSRNWIKELITMFGSSNRGASFDEWWRRLVAEINPARDVDCLTAVNLDRVYRGKWKILPATARAVLSILEKALNSVEGKNAVVVGKSELVGRPLAHVLAQRGARVKLCGSAGVVARSIDRLQFTTTVEPEDLGSVVSEAKIVVSATGRPGLITGEMVKRGAVVIDVGEPVGDVEFSSVKKKAAFITPVPGGVGPVTVVSLLENLTELV